jgi:ClpP class serine protease
MPEAMRTHKIAGLERKRHSRVVLLVHREETMKLLGFPSRAHSVNDSEAIVRAIDMTDVPMQLRPWSQ